MEHFENEWGRRYIDNGGGDDLVHGFVVSRAVGIVEEASTAAMHVYWGRKWMILKQRGCD